MRKPKNHLTLGIVRMTEFPRKHSSSLGSALSPLPLSLLSSGIALVCSGIVVYGSDLQVQEKCELGGWCGLVTGADIVLQGEGLVSLLRASTSTYSSVAVYVG